MAKGVREKQTEQGGLLLLTQADHLSGEEISFAIDQIMNRGARNVCAFPGITKKGRPACVLLIDADEEDDTDWVNWLAEEYSVYGIHRIRTRHLSVEHSVRQHTIIIRRGRKRLTTEGRFKGGRKGSIRIEYGDLVKIREKAQEEFGVTVSLAVLRTLLNAGALSQPRAKEPILIDL